MPIMQPLTKIDTRAMQRIDERSFHQPRFVDRPARMKVRTRRPFNHPMKHFKLAELRLPVWDTFGTQVIYKRLLAGSCAHGEQWTQVFIEEIPFLLETVESAGGFFFNGLFHGEKIFVGKFLRRHESSLSLLKIYMGLYAFTIIVVGINCARGTLYHFSGAKSCSRAKAIFGSFSITCSSTKPDWIIELR